MLIKIRPPRADLLKEELKVVKGRMFLEVPAEIVYLALIRKAIVELAEKAGFPKGEVDRMEMAVDEACTHIIRHSYDGHEEAQRKANYQWRRQDETRRPLDLQVNIDGEKISIILTDRGKGFDLSRFKPDLDEYVRNMEVGGLGIYVIKTFMDEVSYSHKPTIGNVLRMVKYFNK